VFPLAINILIALIFVCVSTVFGQTPPQASFAAAVNYAVGTTPYSVAVGDFNGDGRADLAVANEGSGTVSVLLGNGDGTFQAAVNYAVGTTPGSVAVGDFNGDGKADLAVTNFNGTVSVLLGNGDGTFQAALNYRAGPSPGVTSVAVGDFNRDGKADLAVTDDYGPLSPDGTVNVLLGNGDGTFQAAVNYTVGSEPQSVGVGDFNGDGKADLAVTDYSSQDPFSGAVNVLLGNGDGTFQAAVNYSVGPGATSVAVGDFNCDGKADLAVTNFNGTVSVLLGNGDGTFQAAVNYIASPGATSVAVGDFNRDGKADLAEADVAGTVSVLLGNGDGTFQAAVNFTVGLEPQSVGVGDFNGDGKADLAVANEGTASILLNTTMTQPARCLGNITSSRFVNTSYTSSTIPFFGGEGAGIATDPQGNVYIGENPFPFQTDPSGYFPGASPAILRVSPDGVTQTLLAPGEGFGEVTAVAFYQGHLYVADGNGYTNTFFMQPTAKNVIWEYDPNSSAWSKVIPNVNDPTGLAFWNGNIYVSSWADQKVYVFSGVTGEALGTVWTAPDASAAPYGIAFDGSGNLYIAGAGFGLGTDGTKIFKVADVTGSPTPTVFVDPGIHEPTSLAFDSNGNLFASYYNSLEILRVAPDGTTFSVFPGAGTSAAAPNGIAIDHNNLFTVINFSDIGGQVIKIQGLVGCSQITPVINWPTPSPILYGTALSATQLNATAVDVSNNPIAGTFTYTPPAGTVPNPGVQTLSVIFTPADGATYASKISTVQLAVNQPPTVTTNPVSQTVTAGSNVTFAAAATGYPAPTVQWQVSTNGGATFTNLSSATSTTLTLTPVTTSQNGYLYRAVFTNLVGSATTTPATLTVTTSMPTLTSITPTSGARGTSVTVTFTGTNLNGAFAVTGIGALIPVTNLTVSNTTVTATLNISRLAPLGIRNLGLTTPGGTSNTEPFRVTGGTPAFAGPAPAMTSTPANLATKTGTVTLSNSATGANAGPLVLTAVPAVKRASGTGEFTITGGTCISGTVLKPGDSCTIIVQYVPPTTGLLTSTAHVTISDTGALTATQNSANFTAD